MLKVVFWKGHDVTIIEMVTGLVSGFVQELEHLLNFVVYIMMVSFYGGSGLKPKVYGEENVYLGESVNARFAFSFCGVISTRKGVAL